MEPTAGDIVRANASAAVLPALSYIEAELERMQHNAITGALTKLNSGKLSDADAKAVIIHLNAVREIGRRMTKIAEGRA